MNTITNSQISIKYTFAFLFILITFQSCDNCKELKSLNKQLKEEKSGLLKDRNSLRKEREIIKNYHKEFNKIQSKLEEIERESNILINPYLEEGQEERGEKVLRYIESLDRTIASLKEEISKNDILENPETKELEKLTRYYEKKLNDYKLIIEDLQNSNIVLEEKLAESYDSLQRARTVIIEKDSTIKKYTGELNKKHCYVILKNNYKYREIKGNCIRFNIKIKLKDILSSHSPQSFHLSSKSGNSKIQILDLEEFWKDTDIIFIRSNKKSCAIGLNCTF
ncbi:MAG: hypothetical protein WBB45_15860 [Cyclobacteriaceae bacterium]